MIDSTLGPPALGPGLNLPARPVRLASLAVLGLSWALMASGCGAAPAGPGRAETTPPGTPPDEFYRAAWGEAEFPASIAAGAAARIVVSVENTGSYIWPDLQLANGAAGAVRLGHRWIGPGGTEVEGPARTDLPWPLRPGESILLPIVVTAPELPGEYRLQLDLVHEMVSWFGSRGAQPLDLGVTVRPAS